MTSFSTCCDAFVDIENGDVCSECGKVQITERIEGDMLMYSYSNPNKQKYHIQRLDSSEIEYFKNDETTMKVKDSEGNIKKLINNKLF